MPTHEDDGALRAEEVRDRVASIAYPSDAERRGGTRLGLEPEMFALRWSDGAPGDRVPLHGPDGSLAIVDALAEREDWFEPRDPTAGAPRFELRNGGSFTFEPGGQIEHSTAVHDTAALALADVDRARSVLCGAFLERGIVLAKAGVDPWHAAPDVPQQLDAPRYHAMAAYLASRGTSGAVMMRNTATLQINLDLGADGVARDRWLAANLLSPLITATFATSPGADETGTHWACRRARAWQHLDPTRSGYHRLLLEGSADDPIEVLETAALEADVLLFRGPGGSATPGTPGFSFGDWIANGHPEHGRPTADDFDYHLTTLFFEVRVRGFLELRAMDALPDPWHSAAVVLVVGALYDDRARDEVVARLGGERARLRELWEGAASEGIRHPRLAELAAEVWPIALEGARRMPSGYFTADDFARADAFLERFPARGRMLGDELLEALAEGPAAALAWARGDAPCPHSGGVGA